MKRNRKYLWGAMLAVILLTAGFWQLFSSSCALADAEISSEEIPDLTRNGSISLTIRDMETDEPVGGGSITFYLVANPVVSDGKLDYELTEPFKKFKKKSTDMSDLGSPKLAQDLSDYVGRHKKTVKGVTIEIDENGILLYEDVVPGLYLLRQEKPAPGYLPLKPFLIRVPSQLEDGSWVYDVSAYPKMEPGTVTTTTTTETTSTTTTTETTTTTTTETTSTTTTETTSTTTTETTSTTTTETTSTTTTETTSTTTTETTSTTTTTETTSTTTTETTSTTTTTETTSTTTTETTSTATTTETSTMTTTESTTEVPTTYKEMTQNPPTTETPATKTTQRIEPTTTVTTVKVEQPTTTGTRILGIEDMSGPAGMALMLMGMAMIVMAGGIYAARKKSRAD